MTQFIPDSSFPLYDLLLNKCNKMIEEDPSKADITVQEVREMIDGIQLFERDIIEHVFVIIRVHSLRNEQTKVFDTPYKGNRINNTTGGDGDIKFDIRNMPPLLRRMLLEFVRMNSSNKD
jgi:hypothetical protein